MVAAAGPANRQRRIAAATAPPANAVSAGRAAYWKWSATSENRMNDIGTNPRTGTSTVVKHARAIPTARAHGRWRYVQSSTTSPTSAAVGHHVISAYGHCR